MLSLRIHNLILWTQYSIYGNFFLSAFALIRKHITYLHAGEHMLISANACLSINLNACLSAATKLLRTRLNILCLCSL